MTDDKNSTSSYVALNNDWFLYAFVDCSTDIEVVITELLEYTVMQAKASHSLPFIMTFKHTKDLNNELIAWCIRS